MKINLSFLTWLKISCRESTRLTELKLSVGIHWWLQIKLRVHQRMCVVCKYYEQQSLLIDKALQHQNAPQIYKLDEASKAKIRQLIAKKSK